MNPYWNTLAWLFVRASSVCALLVLGACSLLPKPEAQQTYVLPSFTPLPQAAAPTGWALRVGTPLAIDPLDSRQIIVQHPNARLAFWRGIRWSDRVPVLLREQLTQMFSDSRLFSAVIAGNTIAPADVDLTLSLHTFQLMHAGTSQGRVEVRLQAQLVNSQHPNVMDQQTFAHAHAVEDSGNPDAVIAAFGHAVDHVAHAMSHWLQTLAQAQDGAGIAP